MFKKPHLYTKSESKLHEREERSIECALKAHREDDKKIFDILCPLEIAYQRLGQLHWFHKMVLLWEVFQDQLIL